MNTKRPMPLVLAAIALLLAGCSGKKETATSDAVHDEVSGSPEAVFEAMKEAPELPQAPLVPPDERPMPAHQTAAVARAFVAFEQEPEGTDDAEKGLETLIPEYGLPALPEFTDQEERIAEQAPEPGAGESPPEPPRDPSPSPQPAEADNAPGTWTSSDGSTLEAWYWGMDGGVVRLKNASTGEVHSLPYGRLSPESLARAKAAYLAQPRGGATTGDPASPRRLPRKGEVVFEAAFDAGTTYTFKKAWERDERTKMAGEREKAESSEDSILVVEVQREKNPDRCKATLSLDRFKVKRPSGVKDEWMVIDSEQPPSDEGGKTFFNMMKRARGSYLLGGQGRTLVSGAGGGAELFGPHMESMIRHFTETLPADPVSRGQSWDYTESRAAGPRRVSVELSCRYTGPGSIPGGGSVAENQGRFRKVTFSGTYSDDKAGRAKPARSRSQDDNSLGGLVGDLEIKSLKLTGEMYYDPKRRMVIYYQLESSLSIEGESALGDISNATTEQLTCELVAMKASEAPEALPEQDGAGRTTSPPQAGGSRRSPVDGGSPGPADQPQPDSGTPGAGTRSDGKHPTPDLRIAERQWTDSNGRTLTASLEALDGNLATFKRPDGTIFQYEVTELSEDDQKLIADALNATPSRKWSRLEGTVVTVAADPREACQTGITLTPGDRYRLYPHPDDRWNTRPDQWEDVDYRGHGSMELTSVGRPFMQLCFRVGSAGVEAVEPGATIAGSGLLQLFPSDALSRGGDPSDNRGSIRVKVVREP